jgi:hypothetical protein
MERVKEEVKKMVLLTKNIDGYRLETVPEGVVMALLRREGGIIDPSLLEEEWFTEDDLEALGLGVKVSRQEPLPGEVVFVPTRTGKWAKVRVA